MTPLYEIVALGTSDGEREGCAAALGEFDGVHIGHRALLDAAVAAARGRSMTSAAVMFASPLPTKGERALLCPRDEKLRRIARCGVDRAVLLDFNSVRGMTPEGFVGFLSGELNIRLALCGGNYRFGAGACGDAATLRSLMRARGGDAEIIPPVMYRGREVSSSLIRACLAGGKMEAVAGMLGRAYTLCGEIRHGQGIGHTLGTPTVNITPPPGCELPRKGVYFSRCVIGEKTFNGVTNLGTHPTVGGEDVVCETYLLNYRGGGLYGRTASVSLLEFRRDETRFCDTSALSAAITADIAAAEEYFTLPEHNKEYTGGDAL